MDLAAKTVSYYVDRQWVCDESLAYDAQTVCYLNINARKGAEYTGSTVLFDNLTVGYGRLTPEYFMTPVLYKTGSGTFTRFYEGEIFLLPADAPTGSDRSEG